MNRIQDASLESSNHAENQAATWLVRLDADNSAEAVRHWQAWMKEDVRRRAAFVRLEEGWRQTDCLKSLKPLDGTVNPNLLDTFPGVTPAWPTADRVAAGTSRGVSTLAGTAESKPKVSYWELAVQTVAVALAAGMLAGKLVLSCWLFISLDGPG